MEEIDQGKGTMGKLLKDPASTIISTNPLQKSASFSMI